jgi:alkyl sulfatase BDS1-like metallo-beta-lactamase superfamily hydrolase
MYAPSKDDGFCVRLDMPDGTATVVGTPDGFEIHTGDNASKTAQAIFSGTSAVLDSILFGNMTIEAAVTAGDAKIAGDRIAIDRFLRAFPMPAAMPGIAS